MKYNNLILWRPNLYPEYNRYKSPDILAEEFRRAQGEFSIDWYINFQRYLARIDSLKAEGKLIAMEWREDMNEARREIKGKLRDNRQCRAE